MKTGGEKKRFASFRDLRYLSSMPSLDNSAYIGTEERVPEYEKRLLTACIEHLVNNVL